MLKLSLSSNTVAHSFSFCSLPGLKIALPSLFLCFSVYISTQRGEGSTSGLATQPNIWSIITLGLLGVEKRRGEEKRGQRRGEGRRGFLQQRKTLIQFQSLFSIFCHFQSLSLLRCVKRRMCSITLLTVMVFHDHLTDSLCCQPTRLPQNIRVPHTRNCDCDKQLWSHLQHGNDMHTPPPPMTTYAHKDSNWVTKVTEYTHLKKIRHKVQLHMQ